MASRRTGFAAAALAVLAAGIGPGPQPAGAAVVTDAVTCVPPPWNGPDFDWQPQIDLVVAPQKAVYAIGDKVTVTWRWKTPPRNPSNWVVVAVNSSTPTGVVKAMGAQNQDIAVAGPKGNPTSWGSQPLNVADMTGTFTVEKEGRIDLAPGAYSLLTSLSTKASTCTPKGVLNVSASLQAGTATPPPGGGTGGSTGGPGGTGPSTTGPSSPGNSASPGATAGSKSPSPSGTSPSASATTGDDLAAGPGSLDLPPPLPAEAPAGPLYMTQSLQGVNIGAATAQNGSRTVVGRINPVTVFDQRGSTLGWSLTGQLGLPAGSTAQPGPGHVQWTPSCDRTGAPAAPGSGAVPGSPFDGALASPVLLCLQNPSTGEVTGGEYQAGTAMTFQLPPGSAGEYVLTLSLT
ncbi:hypothetical protein [Yinghuangia soli]|uniref:Uncharacterized protein n=1 Tax=Yinghuangia soli TaxID=2908204 RepID=A0AA41U494_9ACTN|nr:hypothetical protein [Yinghuangia soli]MCF2532650.1 hypothetical protein [Yinghuangia soli]